MARLMINIDHVATLRNARKEAFPDPIHAAVLAETAGADGIVFHHRVDERHINEKDVRRLKETVMGKLDFELSMNDKIVALCCEMQPDLATIVPEKREEVTTESGIDVLLHKAKIKEVTNRLYDAGVQEVALFVDPDLDQIKATAETGANCIEMHTGEYAIAKTKTARLAELKKLADAANLAHSMGINVHAGHGLDYANYALFKQAVPHISEVSVGFAVIARAMFIGFEQAVREMLRVVKGR
ncbi:MAG: pyridoxine 5'-phosphate synthase [Rhodothermales bacterium]